MIERLLCLFGRHGWDRYVSQPMAFNSVRSFRMCYRCGRTQVWFDMFNEWSWVDRVSEIYLPLIRKP